MSNRDFTLDPELARRRRSFAQKRSLSEYGVSLPDQPEDLSGVHPTDDRYKFFSKGRDFQPRKAKHRFTDEELRTVETFESAAILPSCSGVYKHWLQKSSLGNDSWIVIGLIAIITGILASVMKVTVEKLQLFYLPFISRLVEDGAYVELALYYTILMCTFSTMSAVVVVCFCPVAGGSGLPEIIGILNGCVVRNVLNFKTLVCKMVSCIFTVISTLPVGFEGPMVHIGALVGACMAKPFRFQSVHKRKKTDSEEEETTECFPSFCRYRDCRERHSLICVGAAAGVAAAFSSPIAGLTFAMEEMSSHWSKTLTWQAFVCCILARATAELLHDLFSALENSEHEDTHLYHLSESALFDMRKKLNLNLAIIIPAIFLGLLGGLLGSIFIFFLLKISKFRRRVLAKIQPPKLANFIKICEVLLVSVLSAAAVMMSLQYASCKPAEHTQILHDEKAHSARFFRLRGFQCNETLNVTIHNGELIQVGDFNEGASLLFGSWEQMIRNLFSRRTAGYFDWPILLYVLGFFVIFSSWTSITSIASGLLIPQLAIGALYGRLIGQLINDAFEIPDDSKEWDWIDPGALALLGAASFLSGTSRLPVTSVVMMVEMTNDVNISLLIMLCVMLSKFSGDLLTHSLYHSMLDFKCIPYLESELKIYSNGKRLNLELFRVEDVMKSPVQYVGVKENIYNLANLLLDTNHGGFPVVQLGNGFHRTFLGIITRLELTILLTKTKKFDARELVPEDMDKIRISYPEYSSGKLKDLETVNNTLHMYSSGLKYRNVYVNLLPYINTSAISVPKDFSLYRAYMMFRFLGLRHMVVVDRHNQLEGIITRKDLLGYTVEQKLKFVRNNNIRKGFYIGSPSSDSERSSTSSASPSNLHDVITRADSLTPPQGLQTTVIPEEEEVEDEEP